MASIRRDEAEEILGDLLASTDDDIVEAVREALALTEGAPDEDEENDGL